MIAKNKSRFQQILVWIIPYFAHIHPNAITLFSLLFAVGFLVAMQAHHVVLAFFLLLGTLTDALDGAVARYFHKASRFGALLDSTTDRVSDALLITAFSFTHFVRWEISIPLLIASFLISYIRTRGEQLFEIKMEGIGIMERTERVIGIFLAVVATILLPHVKILTLNISEWIFLVLLILSAYTVWQRLSYLSTSEQNAKNNLHI